MKRATILIATLLLIGAVASLGVDLLDESDGLIGSGRPQQSALEPLEISNASMPAPGKASKKRGKKDTKSQAKSKAQKAAKAVVDEARSLDKKPQDKGKAAKQKGTRQLINDARAGRAARGPRNPGRAGTVTRTPGLPGAPTRWIKGPDGQPVPVYDEADKKVLEEAAEEVAKRRGTVIGEVEQLTKEVVRGYAYDYTKPEITVEIIVYLDGFPHKTLLANQARTASGEGAAAPKGFQLAFGDALKDGKKHLVQVFAKSPGEEEDAAAMELKGSPDIIGGDSLPIGRLDKIADGFAVGWAGDPDDWTRAAEVEWFWDGLSQGRVNASLELIEGGSTDPRLGGKFFKIPLPKFKEGTKHVFQAVVSDLTSEVKRELDRSPFVINPEGPSEDEDQLAKGAITFVNNQQISGWAFDPDDESQSIEVDIFLDGVFHQRQIANKRFAALVHRPDVSNPNHLWIVDVPEEYRDGKEHSVSVFAVGGEGRVSPELDNSPALFRAEVNNIPTGYVDVATPQVLAGWAYDADARASPVDVEIWIDGELWQVVTASGNRPDLVPVVCPEAHHGWHVASPEILRDGGFHQINVYARNTPNGPKQELAGSPREFGKLEPYLGVRVVSEVGRGMKISRVDKDSPAEWVGAKVGDVLVSYNGVTATSDAAAFDAWLSTRTVGEALTVILERDSVIEARPRSSLAVAIRQQIEAYEAEVAAGKDPGKRVLLTSDGGVRLSVESGQLAERWFERTPRTVYPVLGQR